MALGSCWHRWETLALQCVTTMGGVVGRDKWVMFRVIGSVGDGFWVKVGGDLRI